MKSYRQYLLEAAAKKEKQGEFKLAAPGKQVPDELVKHLGSLDAAAGKHKVDFSHHQGVQLLDRTRRAISAHGTSPLTFNSVPGPEYIEGSYDFQSHTVSLGAPPKEYITQKNKKRREAFIGTGYLAMGHELGHHFDHLVPGGAIHAVAAEKSKSDFTDPIARDAAAIKQAHSENRWNTPSTDQVAHLTHTLGQAGFTHTNMGTDRLSSLIMAVHNHRPLVAATAIGNQNTTFSMEDTAHAITGKSQAEPGLLRVGGVSHGDLYYHALGQQYNNPGGGLIREAEAVANIHAAVHGMGERRSSFLAHTFFPNTTHTLLHRLASV